MSFSLRTPYRNKFFYAFISSFILAVNLLSPVLTHATDTSDIPTDISRHKKVSAKINTTPHVGSYTVLEHTAHDPNSFIQGFTLKEGIFYESSGLYNKSYLHKYAHNGSIAEIKTPLADNLFAEGLELVGDKLYLLTWRAEQLLIFNKNTLKQENILPYKGEGWGLTHNGKYFYMSDGSDEISIRTSDDFSQKRRIQVHNTQHTYRHINELEYAKGFIWANVWQSNLILKIQPFSGLVVATYDLTPLTRYNSTQPGHSVLNGIAFDETRNAFWITGKLWPKRYLLQFNDNKPQS